MDITPDSEILRIEKRVKGLNRVTAAINDLSIYGIFYGNYPELVKVLEHAKDHVKAELKLSKERLENQTLKDDEPKTRLEQMATLTDPISPE